MIDPGSRNDASDLRRAVSQLQRSFRALRDPDGPTSAQLSALGALYRHGPMATGELAARERLKPQSVTRFVAALQQAKLIERVPDPGDARRIVVAITDEGRRTLGQVMRRRDERLARKIARLSPADRASVRAATALLEWLASDAD
jgi:DNA-binding MarR family transcriptional regulator